MAVQSDHESCVDALTALQSQRAGRNSRWSAGIVLSVASSEGLADGCSGLSVDCRTCFALLRLIHHEYLREGRIPQNWIALVT
jgi:hypothetical protein